MAGSGRKRKSNSEGAGKEMNPFPPSHFVPSLSGDVVIDVKPPESPFEYPRKGREKMSRQLAKRWITVEEYERMGEAGIFRPDDRLELLEGGIFEMSPIGPPHASCVMFLSHLLSRLFGGSLIVSTQNPVRLDDYSEPQPDVMLLRWRDDFYRNAHPTPADVLLVIEVSDTTTESDRSYKIPLYAGAGIPEAWLVNIPGAGVEVYAEPVAGGYRIGNFHQRDEEVKSHTFAGLSVNDVLG